MFATDTEVRLDKVLVIIPTYNEAENGLWCIDGDRMGLRTLDGQWVWQVPAEGAVLMN